MLAAAPNWIAVGVVAAIVAAAALGLVVGWQLRGYHEATRRGGYLGTRQ